MDFGELLHTAKKNDTSKPQIRYYPTKFAPPKKEQRTKSLSVNVQKFLAKKEAEEKQKQQDAAERRHNLLALRSQDKKATRRVNVMLKRTKSANQSVIADALDTNNTSVTLAGPSQPDEDDYGYVSQESSALYNKMMEKYSKMPDEPKFPEARKKISTNLSSTKDRVKAALEREREEALLPHRRKRKHTENGADDSEKGDLKISEPEIEVEKKDYSKPKFKPAPLVNFSDLLKLAEKKQFEPVIIERKKEDEERPLTKNQKKEYDREREWRERKESRNKIPIEKAPTQNKIPKVNGPAPRSLDNKIPKKSCESQDTRKVPATKEPNLDRTKSLDKNSNIAKSSSQSKISSNCGNISNNRYSTNPLEDGIKRNDLSQKLLNGTKLPGARPSEKSRIDSRNMPPPSASVQQYKMSSDKFKNVPSLKDPQLKKQQQQTMLDNSRLKQALLVQNGARAKQLPVSSMPKSKQLPPSNEHKPKQFPPSDLKPKQAPVNNLKPKQFPPADLRPKQLPPPGIRRNPKEVRGKAMVNKRRILDDDEDEYDSEMDDFIDDGPEEEPDYSKYISEIFGYDKKKYQIYDDDEDNMESSFAQQMKEEVLSSKIGRMEDLEDMRQEEEAKKRKILMKKQLRKL